LPGSNTQRFPRAVAFRHRDVPLAERFEAFRAHLAGPERQPGPVYGGFRAGPHANLGIPPLSERVDLALDTRECDLVDCDQQGLDAPERGLHAPERGPVDRV
jgi:hypothetical protein